MHLRLISPHPTPAVYLSLSFPFTAPHLPLPPTWTFSAQRLANDDLEFPNAIHFLDKSTWIVSVLDQVIFDLSSLTITCHFIDGTKEEWPLVAMDCVRALENVVADVNFALSAEHKRKDSTAAPQSTPLPAPTQPPTRAKHKKSRSFFAPLVTMVSYVLFSSFSTLISLLTSCTAALSPRYLCHLQYGNLPSVRSRQLQLPPQWPHHHQKNPAPQSFGQNVFADALVANSSIFTDRGFSPS